MITQQLGIDVLEDLIETELAESLEGVADQGREPTLWMRSEKEEKKKAKLAFFRENKAKIYKKNRIKYQSQSHGAFLSFDLAEACSDRLIFSWVDLFFFLKKRNFY